MSKGNKGIKRIYEEVDSDSNLEEDSQQSESERDSDEGKYQI